jgi:hypothetical protein
LQEVGHAWAFLGLERAAVMRVVSWRACAPKAGR